MREAPTAGCTSSFLAGRVGSDREQEQWDVEYADDGIQPIDSDASNQGALVPTHVRMRVAERVGFEPSVAFPLYTLSKRAPSATRTSLRSTRSARSRQAALESTNDERF